MRREEKGRRVGPRFHEEGMIPREHQGRICVPEVDWVGDL
jgi:hypothetical protein